MLTSCREVCCSRLTLNIFQDLFEHIYENYKVFSARSRSSVQLNSKGLTQSLFIVIAVHRHDLLLDEIIWEAPKREWEGNGTIAQADPTMGPAGPVSIHVGSVSSVLPPCMVWNSRLEIEKPARLQAMPVTEPVTFLDQSAQVAQNPSWVLVLDIVETDVFNRRMRPGGPTCVTITHQSQAIAE